MPIVTPPTATPGARTLAVFAAVAVDSTAPPVVALPPTTDSRLRAESARATVRPIATPPIVTLRVFASTVRVPVAVTWTPPEPTVPDGDAPAAAVPSRVTKVS